MFVRFAQEELGRSLVVGGAVAALGLPATAAHHGCHQGWCVGVPSRRQCWCAVVRVVGSRAHRGWIFILEFHRDAQHHRDCRTFRCRTSVRDRDVRIPRRIRSGPTPIRAVGRFDRQLHVGLVDSCCRVVGSRCSHGSMESTHCISPGRCSAAIVDRPAVCRPADNTSSALGWNRTSDTRFRKPVLYPLSYEGVSKA